MTSKITPYITAEQIADTVTQLAGAVNTYYKDQVTKHNPLILVVILKGSSIFYADLVRKIGVPVITEFISISSYGANTKSSGEIRLELDTRTSITDHHVLIVEDIIDTGNSLETVLNLLQARHPSSLEIVTLLSKPSRRIKDVKVKFTGFTIPDKFVIGYGLDLDERWRELPFIGVYGEEKEILTETKENKKASTEESKLN